MERDKLTNEDVRAKFTNQFDLVNYTIKLAKEMIKSGRQPRGSLKTDNPALQAIEEVLIQEKELDQKGIESLLSSWEEEEEEETLEHFS